MVAGIPKHEAALMQYIQAQHEAFISSWPSQAMATSESPTDDDASDDAPSAFQTCPAPVVKPSYWYLDNVMIFKVRRSKEWYRTAKPILFEAWENFQAAKMEQQNEQLTAEAESASWSAL
ncbi:hypothetical protein HK102_013474 [Quaeritorhiza haematococci]|nr:hypothetical protein HK102_013474 [Quaeritorhiza haematococci]